MDSTAAPQLIEHAHKSLNFTPFAVSWIPSSARFCLLGQTPSAKGIIQIYQLDQNTEGKLKLLDEIIQGPGYKAATFGASGVVNRAIATGDFDGNLDIIDIETKKSIYKVRAHQQIINCVDGAGGGENQGQYGPPELVTGSRDGCVRVWDPRQESPVVSLEPAEDPAPDCWCTAFGNSYNNEERVIAAGYDNGDIKIFDLRTNVLTWDTNLANGVCGVEFDRKDTMMNKLCATTLEQKIHSFDLRTFNVTEGYASVTEVAHNSTVWQARHLPQNRDLFVTCGGNGSINLYKYNYPPQRSLQDADGNMKGVPGTLTLLNQRDISTQPIASFEWNRDKIGLGVMCCLDQSMRVLITTKLSNF